MCICPSVCPLFINIYVKYLHTEILCKTFLSTEISAPVAYIDTVVTLCLNVNPEIAFTSYLLTLYISHRVSIAILIRLIRSRFNEKR